MKTGLILRIAIILCVMTNRSPAQEEAGWMDHIDQEYMNDTDDNPELQELACQLQQFRTAPLNINTEDAASLSSVGLISDYQYRKLLEYRYIFGDIVSVYELAYIDDWDTATIYKLLPFIAVKASEKDQFSFSGFSGRSKHQLVAGSKGLMEIRKGYRQGLDSAGSPPHYAGPPISASLRYDFHYSDKLQLGIRLEKDAGERWYQMTSRDIPLTDHYSGFVLLRDLGIVSAVCLGDFSIHFGQGLTTSSGSFGRASPSAVITNGPTIRPHSSIRESAFMRGAALTLGKNGLRTTLFISSRKIDPSGAVTDSAGRPLAFVSINRSGLHRTPAEILGKNSVRERVLGITMVYTDRVMRSGITCLYAGYEAPLIGDHTIRSVIDSTGKNILLAGFQVQAMLRKTHLMIEISINSSLGKAFIAGLQALPGPGVKAGILIRHYGAGYWNPYGAGSRSFSSNTEENGIYMGLELQLPSYWRASITADLMNRPHISNDSDLPSNRVTVQLILEKSITSNTVVKATLRYGEYFRTFPEKKSYQDPPGEMTKVNGRIELQIKPSSSLELKSAAEILFLDHPQKSNETGFIAYQDLRFILARERLKIWMRVGLFESSSYDSRMYVYENDLRYEYSSPSFSGSGFRCAFIVNYRPVHWFILEFKAGRLMYEDRNLIGSGWEEINGNRKTEWKVQATFRW